MDMIGSVGGILSITTNRFAKPGDKDWVQLELILTQGGFQSPGFTENKNSWLGGNTFDKEQSDLFAKGSGLAFSIANQIIQEHQGYIEIKPGPASETTITMSLPTRGIATKTSG